MFFRKIFNKPFFLILLAAIYPAVFMASNNWFIVQKHELMVLLVFTPLIAMTLGLVAFYSYLFTEKIVNRVFDKKNNFRPKSKILTVLITVYASFIFFFLLYGSYIEVFGSIYTLITVIVIVTLVFILITYKTGYLWLNAIFLLLICVAGAQGFYSYFSSASSIQDIHWYAQNKDHNSKISFKIKPNVYFIVLESYQDSETLKTNHGIDNSKAEKDFRERGFTIYQNVFSNYSNTLLSLSSIFTMQHHYCKIAFGKGDAAGAREIIGGKRYNSVLSVFKNNGYAIQYISSKDYCYLIGDMVDYAFPKRTMFKAFEMYQNKIIDYFFRNLFVSYKGTKNKKNMFYVDRKDANDSMRSRIIVAANDKKQPYFTFFKSTLSDHYHKKWNEIDKDWIDYPKGLKEATAETIDFIDFILEKDPNCLILVIGDHGTFRYRGIWSGSDDLNRNIRNRNVPVNLVGRDLFGVFFATKWPGNELPEYQINSHVNLFRYIFSFLSKDRYPLKTKVKDESYFFWKTLYAVVRDGIPLENWERLK